MGSAVPDCEATIIVCLIFIIMVSLAVFSVFVVCLVGPTSGGSRRLLEENDVTAAVKDAREGLTSFVDDFWGGSCLNQEQCTQYISSCGDQGKCEPSWLVWTILAFIIFSLVVSCICCICCGICSCIMDCLCC